jgi:hypothetical protein
VADGFVEVTSPLETVEVVRALPVMVDKAPVMIDEEPGMVMREPLLETT